MKIWTTNQKSCNFNETSNKLPQSGMTNENERSHTTNNLIISKNIDDFRHCHFCGFDNKSISFNRKSQQKRSGNNSYNTSLLHSVFLIMKDNLMWFLVCHFCFRSSRLSSPDQFKILLCHHFSLCPTATQLQNNVPFDIFTLQF